MTRPGHHRPLGTTTRVRMSMRHGRDPELGDVVFEVTENDDPDELKRAFLVVGVEEPAPGKRWGLVLERLGYGDAIDRTLHTEWWCFTRDRRGHTPR